MLSGNIQKKLALFLCVFLSCVFAKAQLNDPYVRVAKITVDSNQLISYMDYLKEGVEASIKKEPGVLKMYAVAEKNHPHKITIIETYASKAAYELHIQTTHFQRYKQGTLRMVKSLELIDVNPLFFASKTP